MSNQARDLCWSCGCHSKKLWIRKQVITLLWEYAPYHQPRDTKKKTTKFWAYSNMTSESDHQQQWMSQRSKAKAISVVTTSSAMAPRNDRWPPPHTWGLKAWNEMKSILYFEQCLHGHVVKNAVNTTMTTRRGCPVLGVCLVAFTASIGGLLFARKTFTPAETQGPC